MVDEEDLIVPDMLHRGEQPSVDPQAAAGSMRLCQMLIVSRQEERSRSPLRAIVRGSSPLKLSIRHARPWLCPVNRVQELMPWINGG